MAASTGGKMTMKTRRIMCLSEKMILRLLASGAYLTEVTSRLSNDRFVENGNARDVQSQQRKYTPGSEKK